MDRLGLPIECFNLDWIFFTFLDFLKWTKKQITKMKKHFNTSTISDAKYSPQP